MQSLQAQTATFLSAPATAKAMPAWCFDLRYRLQVGYGTLLPPTCRDADSTSNTDRAWRVHSGACDAVSAYPAQLCSVRILCTYRWLCGRIPA